MVGKQKILAYDYLRTLIPKEIIKRIAETKLFYFVRHRLTGFTQIIDLPAMPKL